MEKTIDQLLDEKFEAMSSAEKLIFLENATRKLEDIRQQQVDEERKSLDDQILTHYMSVAEEVIKQCGASIERRREQVAKLAIMVKCLKENVPTGALHKKSDAPKVEGSPTGIRDIINLLPRPELVGFEWSKEWCIKTGAQNSGYILCINSKLLWWTPRHSDPTEIYGIDDTSFLIHQKGRKPKIDIVSTGVLENLKRMLKTKALMPKV